MLNSDYWYLYIIFIEPFNFNVDDSAAACCGIASACRGSLYSTDVSKIQSVSYLTWKHCTSIKSEFNQCHDRIRIKFWIKFNLINHVTSDCSNMQFQCHPSRILTTKLCTNNLTRRHSALNRKYSQVLIIIPSRWTLHDLPMTSDDSSNDLRWHQRLKSEINLIETYLK